MAQSAIQLFESVKHPRILVIGDMMLDHYAWGEADRVSPEGPVPVMRITYEEQRPGGAGNVVVALHSLGARPTACGILGDDAHGQLIARQMKDITGNADGLLMLDGRPTTSKTRYLGFVQSAHRGIQHMLRVDREETSPLTEEQEEKFIASIESLIAEQDGIVLSDYNKGALTERVIQSTIALAKEKGIPIITDPKVGRPYSIYRGSTVITPNRFETQEATGIRITTDDDRKAAAEKLIKMADLEYVVITLDSEGLYLAGHDEPGHLIPTRGIEVVDVTGAGDMIVSVLAMMLAGKAPIHDSLRIANAAAGVEVSRVGAAPVSRSEIIADLLSAAGGSPKVKALEDAAAAAAECRRHHGKVVFTNGCFDIFHSGHSEYLRFARQQGDMLVIGINSDASVRRLKGPKRPITPEEERARVLAALDVIDCVVIFDDDTPTRLIEAIRPDILVKGGDYNSVEEVVGHDLVASWGGKVVLAPLVEGFSTTALVNRILELHKDEE
jgi:D-beta-D-heptose 7-phosphate kinase / D-beta-D-heptose 1-phosphate adenosyltransferase